VTRVKLTVLSDASARSIVQALVSAFAAAGGIPADDERRLEKVVAGLVDFTLDQAYPEDDLGEIQVKLEADADLVHVTVHDWGLPLLSAGGVFGPLPEPLAAIEQDAQSVQLLNLGSGGKRLVADVPARSSADEHVRRHHLEEAAPLAKSELSDAIKIRAATADDAEAIAQLLYENYHLSYVHADFYRPRFLIAGLASGELLSAVAVHDGRVVGHHALMPRPGVPSAETGAAVVHSAYRGLGLFGRLFEQTLGAATEQGFASVFGDAVTIHPFSQRAEASHGYHETALQLGMVPAQTTMRGFGSGGPRRRTATLRSYRPLDGRPRQAALPDAYRELLERIYANVGLSIEPGDERAPVEGDPVTADLDKPRSLGFLRLRLWDGASASALKQQVRRLLSRHADVIYADIDLAAVEDVDEATAAANDLGFFVSGLILHGADGHDHLRLQLLDSTDIELEDIVCDSPFAESLSRSVLEDKSRVGV
jgi:anti-sigma regulatory factor (Ser/Thr protein kinase)/N-acetylglutamate synthase-like GNAT family acetyltransferase